MPNSPVGDSNNHATSCKIRKLMEINVSIFISGSLRGSKVVKTPCLIGRSKDAELTVAHPAMSRKHCELYEEGGKIFLRDNSSLNGTLFKGEYVEDPIELKFGEEFVVGELLFKISEPASPLTDEQKELANRPTAAFAIDSETAEQAEPGMATILEQPGKTPNDAPDKPKDVAAEKPAEKTVEEKSKKGKPKISPKDVQIKF